MIRHYIFDKTTDNGETMHCVKAVMPNCENDAINLIKKHTRGNVCYDLLYKAKMPSSFERVVTCDPRDEFSAAEGLKKADERLMNSYNDCRERAVKRYIAAATERMQALDNIVVGVASVKAATEDAEWYEKKAAKLLSGELK